MVFKIMSVGFSLVIYFLISSGLIIWGWWYFFLLYLIVIFLSIWILFFLKNLVIFK